MARPLYSLQRQDSTAHSDQDDADVFADRYALEDSDIYAPGTMSRRSSTTSDQEYHAITTSVAAHYAPEEPQVISSDQRRELRNSIRKSRGFLENPFGSNEDEHDTQYAPGPSMATALAPQVNNDNFDNESVFADGHSVSQAGPSHDYSRYTQNTTAAPLTRSPTVPSVIAPQSTGRQSLHGPAHPYNMYPQNVEDDLDDTASQMSGPSRSQTGANRIPVGFPPQLFPPSRFRHDADNVSEQLPPYSEYPEDGAPKHVDVNAPPMPAVIEIPTPTSASTSHTPIAMGRVPQSMSDGHNGVVTDVPQSEASLISHENKPWNQKSWKEKRKTKFCGIPFGWIILAAGVLLFIVIVCSATIGGLLKLWAKHHPKPNEHTLVDAQPVNQPAKPLPTGSFQLQMGSSQETEQDCVTDPSQRATWDCGISTPNSMAITIANSPDGKDQTAQLFGAISNPHVGYGTEIPQTIPVNLTLVKDMDSPTMGNAYQFQVAYTKTVVVKGTVLQPTYVNIASSSPSPSSQPSARSVESLDKRWGWAPLAQPGDQPWFCYWNTTLVEGFIYTQQNSTSWYSNSSWSRQWHKNWPHSGGNSNNNNNNGYGYGGGSGGPPPPGPPPGGPPPDQSYTNYKRDTPLTVDSSSHSPSTTGAVTANSTSPTPTESSGPSCTYQSGTMYGATPTDTGTVCPPPDEGQDAWSKLQFYPLVVKIEERRVPGDNSPAFCQKMQINADGSASVIHDPQGQPYTQYIQESSPGLSAYESVYGTSSTQSSSKKKRATVQGACHCQWFSGEVGNSH
ncbi:hypothetical protein K461DRAFT_316613 [Myriangium duriaei CBS 260.36]|uniref:DUF7820 domain-containing protein n=1 Tax=Myriangium duriaei CBS 260.36 TaxID=1168546 RepID=A0A9P4IQ96_9PEZI|nr:hypothetical protein K461DRAFT_316613 [Myriangium duriaei CBS 260.36]